MYFSKWPAALDSSYQLSQDDFNFRCMSTDVPMYESQSTVIQIRGQQIKQPGIYVPRGVLNFQMIETVDNKVSNLLKQWREICWASQTGVQQTKARVESTLYLQRLDRQDNPIWDYLVYGAFLENFDPTGGSLGDFSAEVLRPTFTLSYDYFLDSDISGGAGQNVSSSSNAL